MRWWRLVWGKGYSTNQTLLIYFIWVSYSFYVIFIFWGRNPIPGPSIPMIFQDSSDRPSGIKLETAWYSTTRKDRPRAPRPASSGQRVHSCLALCEQALLVTVRCPLLGPSLSLNLYKNWIFGKFDFGIFGYAENVFWAILTIWNFQRNFGFSNFRQILDRAIHNFSYVDLYMDRTIHNSVLKLIFYWPRLRINPSYPGNIGNWGLQHSP